MFDLTPEMVRASYDLLCTTPPFNTWNLPDSDDVVFRVDRSKTVSAWQTYDSVTHTICASRECISSLPLLIRYVAHEMVHVHEANVRAGRSDVQHGTAWKKWAEQVCKIHGFDQKAF